MHGKVFNEIVGQVQELRSLCDIQAVEYMTKISTLEVTVSQQMIQIKKLEEERDRQKITIKYLMEERGEYPMENCGSCDQQGINEHCIEHHDLAQGTIYAKCQEGCNEPEPYSYTHPIRDVPDYSKVKRSS